MLNQNLFDRLLCSCLSIPWYIPYISYALRFLCISFSLCSLIDRLYIRLCSIRCYLPAQVSRTMNVRNGLNVVNDFSCGCHIGRIAAYNRFPLFKKNTFISSHGIEIVLQQFFSGFMLSRWFMPRCSLKDASIAEATSGGLETRDEFNPFSGDGLVGYGHHFHEVYSA